MIEICDPCANAVQDNIEAPLSTHAIVTLAIHTGDAIADHLCEKVDNNANSCKCACNANGGRIGEPTWAGPEPQSAGS